MDDPPLQTISREEILIGKIDNVTYEQRNTEILQVHVFDIDDSISLQFTEINWRL